jgi:site-specific DNA-methyltransferase (adenine-specific)
MSSASKYFNKDRHLLINTVHRGNCTELMKKIPDKSINMILCDLPYGTTSCKWDVIIPFESLWEQYERIIKDDGAIVLTASQPFTSMLIMSNLKWFKYEMIWGKSKCGSPFAAKYRPMAKHENILVFGKGRVKYNPEMLYGKPYKRDFTPMKLNNHNFGIKKVKTDNKGTRYPDTILFFQQKWRRQDQIHPTQKPVALFEYLIKTYTDEGDLVLDNCAGSFTTAIASENLKRNWICIEKEKQYCIIGEKRIQENREKMKRSLFRDC